MKFYRYLAYSIEILLLYVLGSTPDLFPQIYGSTACLLVASALTFAVFEHEVPAMFFGVACGVLTDLGFSNSIGIFTISLAVVCFALGFCSNNIITATFLNFILIATCVISAVLTLHFVFEFVVTGYDNSFDYFVNHYISRIIQTIVVSAILYFVNKFVYETLRD